MVGVREFVAAVLTVATITSAQAQTTPNSADAALERAYWTAFEVCRDQALLKFDDHKADPDLVADAVVGVCQSAFDKILALRTASLSPLDAAVFRQGANRGTWTSVRQLIMKTR